MERGTTKRPRLENQRPRRLLHEAFPIQDNRSTMITKEHIVKQQSKLTKKSKDFRIGR